MTLEDERIERIAGRLLSTPQTFDADKIPAPVWPPEVPYEVPPVPAAVLVPIVRRQGVYSVLYTQRAPNLRSHSGQIAFPGGKVDSIDDDVASAALREANEEVALMSNDAAILGYLPTMYTGTNYLITPVVALVEPKTPFVANPEEVHSLFEVPLSLLAQESSYARRNVERDGRQHSTWLIEFEDRQIWGITANLTRQFRDLGGVDEESW